VRVIHFDREPIEPERVEHRPHFVLNCRHWAIAAARFAAVAGVPQIVLGDFAGRKALIQKRNDRVAKFVACNCHIMRFRL
jgi:hypothetical protein